VNLILGAGLLKKKQGLAAPLILPSFKKSSLLGFWSHFVVLSDFMFNQRHHI
jgi:hypothetical protein